MRLSLLGRAGKNRDGRSQQAGEHPARRSAPAIHALGGRARRPGRGGLLREARRLCRCARHPREPTADPRSAPRQNDSLARTNASQVPGQPAFSTTRRGMPNGKSMAATHGPALERKFSNVSRLAREARQLTASTSPLSRHDATAIGRSARGVSLKSSPYICIGMRSSVPGAFLAVCRDSRARTVQRITRRGRRPCKHPGLFVEHRGALLDAHICVA